MTALNHINNLDGFQIFLTKLQPIIGRHGGRYYKKENDEIEYKLNDIVRAFEEKFAQLKDSDKKSLIKQIRALDQMALNLLDESDTPIKITTFK